MTNIISLCLYLLLNFLRKLPSIFLLRTINQALFIFVRFFYPSLFKLDTFNFYLYKALYTF